jgi:outer membrane lipoprotein-sorting protein
VAVAQDKPASPNPPANPEPTKPAISEPAAKPEPSKEVQPMTAEEVLAKMAEAYKGCKSYEDEGEVAIKFDTPQRQWTDRRPFKTAFVRPNKLRYEFTSKLGPMLPGPSTRYVVWADGTKIRSWWSIQPKVETFSSFNMALAGPTGVSGRSAITVPSLLFDMQRVTRLDQLASPTLAGEEQVDSAACLKVEGKGRRGEPVTLWLDKEMFLIRKIFQTLQLTGFTTELTTTYKPKVGTVIPDDTFQFTPPKE